MNLFDEKMENFLCLSCYNLFKRAKSLSETKCIHCGRVFTEDELDYLEKTSFESVYFGYMYGTRYDEQRKIYGKIVEAYFLSPPPEVLRILGELVIIGIISGLSYSAFLKLVAFVTKKKPNAKLRKQVKEMSEKELKEFYKYVRDHYLKSKTRSKELERTLKKS